MELEEEGHRLPFLRTVSYVSKRCCFFSSAVSLSSVLQGPNRLVGGVAAANSRCPPRSTQKNILTSNYFLIAVGLFVYIPPCPLPWALMILLTTSSLSVTIPSPLMVNTTPYIGKLLILATRMNYSFTEYPLCTSLYHFHATHDLPFLILCDCVAPRHSISFFSFQWANAIETSLRIAASLSRLGPRDKQQAKQQAAEFETPPSLSSTSFTASPCLLKKTRAATYNRRLELQVVFIATCVFRSWCLRYLNAPDVVDHVVLTLAPGHRCCAQLLVVFQAEVRFGLLLLSPSVAY